MRGPPNSWEKQMSDQFKCLAAAGSAALIVACLSGARAADKKYDIVTVVKIDGIQWFDRMEEGVRKFAADTGNNAYQLGPDKGDAQLQVQLIEEAIAKKVDAIAVVPFSPEALEPVLKKAMAAGIKVVSHEAATIQNVDLDIEAFRNAGLGEHYMKTLGECMGGKGEYAVFVASPASTTSPTTPSWAPRATGSCGCDGWPRSSPRWSVPAPPWRHAPPNWPRPTC